MRYALMLFIAIFLLLISTTSCYKNYSYDNYYYGSPPSIIRPGNVTSPDYSGF